MRLLAALRAVSWRDLAVSVAPFALALVLAVAVTLRFLQPAPPTHLVISAGPPGSAFEHAAQQYQRILARNGVTLQILASEGSQDNLHRLADDAGAADIGFVQGGLADAVPAGPGREGLVSLGSLFYEPLYIFYRGAGPIPTLAALQGRRIALGPEGSGTRALALAVLKANGVAAPAKVAWAGLGGAAMVQALLQGRIEAAFVMSDSSAPDQVRALLHAPGIRLFNVTQADAYRRRFRYLGTLELGPGSFDLGRNLPAAPLTLLAPTVELVARAGLHPALSDLLIETAREVHGRGGLLHATGEFPAPLDHEYPISEDASRFYKSGKSLSYRLLPFWLASLVDRVIVVLVPALLVLIPALRLIPGVYAWRIRRRIHRRYAELMALERRTLQPLDDAQRQGLRERLEEIDKSVIDLKIPAAFADQVYVLREHIGFVRARLQ